jgi:hypothetical protein
VSRSPPPKGINITNRAGISTKDPLSAETIKPRHHGEPRAEYFSQFCVGFASVSGWLCIQSAVHLYSINCVAPFMSNNRKASFGKPIPGNFFLTTFFGQSFSDSFFGRPLRTSLQSTQVNHSDIQGLARKTQSARVNVRGSISEDQSQRVNLRGSISEGQSTCTECG